MAEIVLATLNARYTHASFGLRYLMANLGELRPQAHLLEFDIHQRPLDIAEALLAKKPRIVGLGVYIWNVAETTDLVALLKRAQPELCVILGGPEVSYETEEQPIVGLADYVITGEADLKFAEVCRRVLAGSPPVAKVIPAELPDLSRVVLPYDFYTEEDVAHRIIYVEASRGCPFTCEFCLSSLDVPVRQFPLEAFLAALERLLARGVTQFKFVDRTFNLNLGVSRRILEFFHARYRPGLFVHFEMIPDRLPAALREVIARFPPGALQFEIGIQSFNPEVCARIRRRQDNAKTEENLRFLREKTGVHIHADLILGLPGETLESIAAGFDRLVALGPHEIQVGILKRLRGTPITRHDAEWQMVYSPHPPYEILQNKLIDFGTMQRLRRFARYWDLFANSGNFIEATPLLWQVPQRRGVGSSPGEAAVAEVGGRVAGLCQGGPAELNSDAGAATASPFHAFLSFSDWLYARLGRTHQIALTELAEQLFYYLTEVRRLDCQVAAAAIARDFERAGHRERLKFLARFEGSRPGSSAPAAATRTRLKRQTRHLQLRGAPANL